MDFHGFPSMSAYNGKVGPAAPIETFARFQAGSCHLRTFIVFYGLSKIFIDFHRFWAWIFDAGKGRAVASIETFARFQAGFLSSGDFHRIS